MTRLHSDLEVQEAGLPGTGEGKQTFTVELQGFPGYLTLGPMTGWPQLYGDRLDLDWGDDTASIAVYRDGLWYECDATGEKRTEAGYRSIIIRHVS